MASLLAVKRRLPVLMTLGRLGSWKWKCSFDSRERESEGGKVGLARKINGAPPDDLEIYCRPKPQPGFEKCALFISETKYDIESSPVSAQDLSPKHKFHSIARHYTSTSLKWNANANRDMVMHSLDKDFSPYFTVYSVDEKDGNMSPKYYFYPPSSIKEDWVFSGASCNGLFHLYNMQLEHVLWNPTTDAIKTLPMNVVPRPLIMPEMTNSVMWYDHKHQNYKLLQLVSTDYLDEEGEFTGESSLCIWLYSLKHNSWKEIPCPGFTIAGPSPACIDGVYYCDVMIKGGCDFSLGQAILSFDFSAETYSILKFPLVDGISLLSLLIPLEYKGQLSVLVFLVDDTEPTKYVLWVWKDECWTRESEFNVSGVLSPLWFSKNGHLLYFERPNYEIVVFDRALGKFKNLGIHCRSCLPQIYPFSECSVQLGGYDEGLDEQGEEGGQ